MSLKFCEKGATQKMTMEIGVLHQTTVYLTKLVRNDGLNHEMRKQNSQLILQNVRLQGSRVG